MVCDLGGGTVNSNDFPASVAYFEVLSRISLDVLSLLPCFQTRFHRFNTVPTLFLTLFLTYNTASLNSLYEVLLQQEIYNDDWKKHQQDTGIQIQLLNRRIQNLI